MSGKYTKKSRGVKVTTLILAFVLVICASVGGTLAWLQAQSNTVTNTFTSAELFANPTSDFTLWEHKTADTDGDGTYEWVKVEGEGVAKVDSAEDADEVTANTYDILPGVDIPKDPTVDVVNLEEHAYLYIKVTADTNTTVDGLKYSYDDMSYSIDSQNWAVLDGTKYPGVYVYCGSNAENNIIKATDAAMKTFTANILENNQIVVANTYDGTSDEINVSFEAYMVQATGNGTDAATAWANTYGKAADSGTTTG